MLYSKSAAGINRIRLEFKVSTKNLRRFRTLSGINRIRLEFKGHRLPGPAKPRERINRIRLEFKVTSSAVSSMSVDLY